MLCGFFFSFYFTNVIICLEGVDFMSDLEGLTIVMLLLVVPILIFLLLILVLEIIGRWKLFKKAGKNGWEAIVPFYSSYVYVEISGLNWWYFLLVIANSFTVIVEDLQILAYPVSLIGIFFCNYNISKKLHKDTLFAVLMTLFPFIMLPLIGFSKNYQWDNKVRVSCNGPINGNDSSNNNSFDGDFNSSEAMNSNSYDNNTNEIKYCSGCGAKLEKSSKFCFNCGREI